MEMLISWASAKIAKFQPIINVLIFGVLIRIVLALYLTHDWDFQVWYISFADVTSGLKSPYATMSFSYPPLWAYTLTPFASIFSLFSNVNDAIIRTNINGPLIVAINPLFNLLVRLPLIASEIFVGLIIFNHVLKYKNMHTAYRSFALWFLNPFVIFISCVFGQFDVLAALMVVLAFIFLLEKKYLNSGLSLGLGALTKIYPIYLLPLYFIFALMDEIYGEKKSQVFAIFKKTLSHYALIFAGLISSFLLILPPLLISGSFSNFLNAVFRRSEYITSLGGISPTNLVYFTGPELFFWLNEAGRPQFLFSSLSIILWSSILLVSLFYAFRSKISFPHQKFLYAQIMAICCIYLTSLMVNPQYIIWILPFLVLCYGIYNDFFKRYIILSISALFFALYWIRPFNSVTIFSSLRQIGDNLNQLYALYLGTIGYPIMVASGLIGAIVIISLFIPRFEIKEILNRLKQKTIERPTFVKLSEKILALVIIVVLIGEILTITYPVVFHNTTSFSVTNTALTEIEGEKEFSVTFSISQGNSPKNLRVVILPIREQPMDETVYVYYDKLYPASDVSLTGWIGFVDHIVPSLKLRGFSGDIEIVNASRLAYVMMNYFDSIIVIPSGVFPNNVHSKNETLVTNFLTMGGTIIWIGDGFGVYSGGVNEQLQWPSDNNPGWESQEKILGYQLSFANPQTWTDEQSFLSYSLNLNYPIVTVGAFQDKVIEHNGFVLGKVSPDRTSIAAVPVGQGWLVLFGGGIGTAFTETGEDLVSYCVGNIILSNVLRSNGDLTVKNFDRTVAVTETIKVHIPKTGISGMTVIAYSVDDFTYFFQREFFTI